MTRADTTNPAFWRALRSFMTLLARDDDDEPDWQALLEAAALSVPGAQAGSLNVRDGHEFTMRAVVGFDPKLLGLRQSAAAMPRWYGVSDAAWRGGQVRLLDGEALRRHINGLPSGAGAPHADQVLEAAHVRRALRANLCLPVVVGGEVVAELNLDSLEDDAAFTSEAVSVAEEFGLLVAAALAAKARRARERASREGILSALSLAIEARDHDTHGHTRRVVTLALALGAQLGLAASTLEDLRQGAILHDIGKLRVPDSILRKPGPLDEAEWRVMRDHTVSGNQLASQVVGVTHAALEVVRHHHERWDGHGYPDGLRGEAIPLLARIFAVCDVYDALVSERPYKRAWTVFEALNEIEAQAGRHFDPVVAGALRPVVTAHTLGAQARA